jgi:hypothetical protein
MIMPQTQTGAPASPYIPLAQGGVDPAIQAQIDEMNTIIAMQQQQNQARAAANQQAVQQGSGSGLSGSGIGSLIGGLYKGGQQAGLIAPPRAQLVKMPGA